MIWLLMILTYAFSCVFCFTLACTPSWQSDEVKRGEPTYVCVSLAPLSFNSTNGTFLRSSYAFSADQLSNVDLVNSWNSTIYETDNIFMRLGDPLPTASVNGGLGITIESGGVTSYQKAYRKYELHEGVLQKVTYPIPSVIINVDRGRISQILWDDNCQWCSAEAVAEASSVSNDAICHSNTYGMDGVLLADGPRGCYVLDIPVCVNSTSTSTATQSTSSLCQLKIFVMWAGTDVDGVRLQSAMSRFSRFSVSQVSQYADSLANIYIT